MTSSLSSLKYHLETLNRDTQRKKFTKNLFYDTDPYLPEKRGIDNIQAYRNAFQERLKQEGVADKIIYLKLLPLTNKDKINNQYFKDGIHLKSKGYDLLCTAIVKAISEDYLEQKHPPSALLDFISLQAN